MRLFNEKEAKSSSTNYSKDPGNSGNPPSWLFSLRATPKSVRSGKVTFNGGNIQKGRIFLSFFAFLLGYLLLKIKSLVRLSRKSVFWSNDFVRNFKRLLVRKLIWSRGKLGRPIANLAVMSIAFLVFTFGEVLNSNKFVNSQELNPDYLVNVSDIIPTRNVATTQIPDERKRAESFKYTVEGGDTLSGIGSKFKISTDALKYVNGLTDNSVLRPGQEITIPPVSGLIHEVEDGDTMSSIAKKYDVAEQAILDFNYILDSSTLAVGTELVIPDAKVPEPVIIPSVPATYIPSTQYAAPTPSGNFCVWPSSVRIITQYFTWYHNGIDIATPWGNWPPIFACTGGVVTRSGWDPWGLGLHVRIDHGNGYETIYGHMSRLDVSYGQRVDRGQQVGVMGNTGRSTGPHLHFVLNYYGVAQNPFNYMN